jgi:hypothetical protein
MLPDKVSDKTIYSILQNSNTSETGVHFAIFCLFCIPVFHKTSNTKRFSKKRNCETFHGTMKHFATNIVHEGQIS